MHHFRAADSRRFINAALTMGVAFLVFGASFGVLAVGAGATILQATVMSLFVFTGASQMSVVSVIASGGSPVSAFGGAVLLAGRNAIYGLALAPVLRENSFAGRLVGSQWVIDETTALVTAEDDPAARRTAFWCSAPILYFAWSFGSFLGAVVGSNIDPTDLGLDAAFPVMFIAMVAAHLRTRAGRRAALFGAVATVGLAPFLPVGLPILVASLGMLFGLSPDATAAPDVTEGMP